MKKTDLEKVKPTWVSFKQFISSICHFAFLHMLKRESRWLYFQTTKRVHWTTKTHKYERMQFSLLCKDCTKNHQMPVSVHGKIKGSQDKSAWVTRDLIEFIRKHGNASGNFWNLEAFYKKSAPVTPSFYCLDILLQLRGKDRKKNELILLRETHCAQMSYFPLLQKIRSKNFLKSLWIFLF